MPTRLSNHVRTRRSACRYVGPQYVASLPTPWKQICTLFNRATSISGASHMEKGAEASPPTLAPEYSPGARPTSDPRSIIERLPPELYLKLLDTMPPVEGVLLSLTCKLLWERLTVGSRDSLYRINRCLSLEELDNFMTCFERDDRQYIFCNVCLKLHRRVGHEKKIFLCKGYHANGERMCTMVADAVVLGPRNHLSVRREALDLIIRASSLGLQFGLCPEDMADNLSYKTAGTPDVTWSCEGLVVLANREHHLLVKTVYQLEVDVRRHKYEQIYAAEVRGCGHDRGEECSKMDDLLKQIGHTNGRAASTPNFQTRSSNDNPAATSHLWQYYQCPACPTDMCVTVSRKPGEVFATLTATAWRNLGPRGDYRNPIWTSQGQFSGYSARGFKRGRGYIFGTRHLEDVYNENKYWNKDLEAAVAT